VVDQIASDFKWSDWPLGLFDFPALCQAMSGVQGDWDAYAKGMVSLILKESPPAGQSEWMFEEITRVPASIASAILFNQTVPDYTRRATQIGVPTLVCFGRDEKVFGVSGGEQLREHLSDARLVVFENSGHCPFLEEPETFNTEVGQFIRSLGSKDSNRRVARAKR
jgi:pimeloyl-ACP methyl ester carboxylesterase